MCCTIRISWVSQSFFNTEPWVSAKHSSQQVMPYEGLDKTMPKSRECEMWTNSVFYWSKWYSWKTRDRSIRYDHMASWFEAYSGLVQRRKSTYFRWLNIAAVSRVWTQYNTKDQPKPRMKCRTQRHTVCYRQSKGAFSSLVRPYRWRIDPKICT